MSDMNQLTFEMHIYFLQMMSEIRVNSIKMGIMYFHTWIALRKHFDKHVDSKFCLF